MLISTKHLKAAGLDVRVTESGFDGETLYEVEIFFKDGHPLSPQVIEEVEDRVGPEFADGLVETLTHKIEGIQILEAINTTGRKAYRDRVHKNNKKGK